MQKIYLFQILNGLYIACVFRSWRVNYIRIGFYQLIMGIILSIIGYIIISYLRLRIHSCHNHEI